MELLAKILGGPEKVKIMRFFLHHDDSEVDLNSLCLRTKSKDVIVKKELTALTSIGFLQKKKGKVLVPAKRKSDEPKIKEGIVYFLNKNFPHNDALKELLFDFKLLDKKDIALLFKHIGRIRLFILGGIFVEAEKSRVDILIVGEAINLSKAEKIIDILSSELGRALSVSIMDTEEYDYRRKMYDKFIGDIFTLPHEIVINKLAQKD